MKDKVVLDKGTFRALAAENRIRILKLLTEKQHTLSDFAELLNLGKSTVKEHLDVLKKAGLIKLDEERKIKYYKLTFKGRRFIQPNEVRVFFAFITSLIALPASIYLFFRELKNPLFAKTADRAVEEAILFAEKTPEITQFPTFEMILIIVFALMFISSLCYLLYKRYGGGSK